MEEGRSSAGLGPGPSLGKGVKVGATMRRRVGVGVADEEVVGFGICDVGIGGICVEEDAGSTLSWVGAGDNSEVGVATDWVIDGEGKGGIVAVGKGDNSGDGERLISWAKANTEGLLRLVSMIRASESPIFNGLLRMIL